MLKIVTKVYTPSGRLLSLAGDRPTPVDFKLSKLLAYYGSEAMKLKEEGEYF